MTGRDVWSRVTVCLVFVEVAINGILLMTLGVHCTMMTGKDLQRRSMLVCVFSICWGPSFYLIICRAFSELRLTS